jgi:hypothetical protein
MAAKGTEAKKIIMNKILESFPNSFLYNDGKEIRINIQENGEIVQIKVALTCAKTPVGGDGASTFVEGETPQTTTPQEVEISEPTEDEKARLKVLMEKLGM